MADATLQTTNFSFQKIGDGVISATAGQTAAAGVSGKGSQELEPGDYNAMLSALDTLLPKNPAGLTPAGTIAAAGTNAANGTPVAHRIEIVTGADGTKGVTLPTAAVGQSIQLVNTAAAILKVWPKGGSETINALSGGTNIAMAASTGAHFVCGVAGAWWTIPTVPS
jgi:hypothetical protein